MSEKSKKARPARPPTTSDGWATPDWEEGDLGENLERVRTYVESRVGGEIDWYRSRIEGVKPRSRWLRWSAIVLSTLGGLVPLLEAAGVFASFIDENAMAAFRPGQLGYVLLAIAGGLALFDRFFGYSSAWMRYVATMLALEKLRESFRLEWALASRRLTEGDEMETTIKLLELARQTIMKAKEHTEKETEAWIAEFEANLSQLEKDLRKDAEVQKPGAIEVRVSDADKATEGFDLWLDGMPVENAATTMASISPVSPGLHKVTVKATVGGQRYAASRMVSVTAAGIAEVELKLGA